MTGGVLVVAAAIVRDGRVLAARRARPPGGWEFPGGKVEPDETAGTALVREIDEELGVRIEPGEVIGEASDDSIRLVLLTATVSGEPVLGADHDGLRWLAADELDAVDWLPVDRRLLPAVQALVQRRGQG